MAQQPQPGPDELRAASSEALERMFDVGDRYRAGEATEQEYLQAEADFTEARGQLESTPPEREGG